MQDIAYRTHRSTRLYVHTAIVLLVALGLSACGHAKLMHHDGTPFIEHGPRIALENGWVAVDSCTSGHHAVMVLDVEAVHTFPIIPRWVHTDAFGDLRDYRIDGPWCSPVYDGFFGEEYEESPGLQKGESYYAEERCMYRIRAEYTLDPLVTADSTYLAHLQKALPRSGK